MTDFHDEPAQSAFDEAPCGLLHLDSDGVVFRANRTFLRWTGLTSDEVIGRFFHELLEAGSQVLFTTRIVDELWTLAELRAIALRLEVMNGEQLPILVNARLVTSDGAPAGIRLAVFDATNRDSLEREMAASKRAAETSESRVRVLQDAATRLLAAVDDEGVARVLADAVRTGFSASDAAVVAYDDGGKSFRMLAGHHLRPLLQAVRDTRGPNPRALPVDDIIAIGDLEEAFDRSDHVGSLFREAKAAAFSTVSIPDGGEIVGAFVCLYGRPREFDGTAIELHHALAKQAGLAFARVRLEERLRALASIDELTGLLNRRALDRRAEAMLANSLESSQSSAIIFLDLDGFKIINDDRGHGEGDVVLQVVADRIRGAVRADDMVGRFGGDEFVVLCQGADEAAAAAVASRIAAAIRLPLDGLSPAGVTASIGIATFTPGTTSHDSAEAMTRRADAAMYKSKRAGRDQITVDRG